MNSLNRTEKLILVGLIAYAFIPAFGGLFRFLELAGVPALGLPENPRAVASPVSTIIHVLSSALFCVGGAFQFLPSLRISGFHRPFGWMVAVSGCLSAITGLWMTQQFSFPAELQGSLLYSVRILVSMAMTALITLAVIAVRRNNFNHHSHHMLRAYAIGMGASTQTFVGIGWMIATGNEPAGGLRDVLMVFSWAINLLGAEWLIRRFLHTRKNLKHSAGFMIHQS